MPLKPFQIKVAGVTFANGDGRERHLIIDEVSVDDKVLDRTQRDCPLPVVLPN